MLPRLTMPLSLLFCLALLTACAVPEPMVVVQSRVERLSVPDALLICAPHPEPGVIATQRDVAEYAVILADAGEDCRSKLASVKALVK
jgi:hypothetical protein